MKEHEMISAITLRDYFAAQAMHEEMASKAYQLADAMLKVREE
jgi:hypothetical protein